MRWERLFTELEAQAADVELQQRDELVDELRDGDWAETSWHDLLGGRVALQVLGVGRLDGDVVVANECFIQLRGDRADHVVACAAVLAVLATQRRADRGSRVVASLRWGHVFRALRDAGDRVRVWSVDGSAHDGTIGVVGRDFVRLREDSGRETMVPWTAVAAVSGPG